MKLLAVASLLFVGTLAMPTAQCGECQNHEHPDGDHPGGNNPGSKPGNNGNNGNYMACPTGLYSNPQCCSTGILGVAALDCENVSPGLSSGADFKSICAKGGRQPLCCVLPVAGQDVLCVEA